MKNNNRENLNIFLEALNHLDFESDAYEDAENEAIKIALELNDMEVILDLCGGLIALMEHEDMGIKMTGDHNFIKNYNIRQQDIAYEICLKHPDLIDENDPEYIKSIGKVQALIETYKYYGINTAQKLKNVVTK